MPLKDISPEIFNRRHPYYAGLEEHWRFVESTYKGGRGWFESNIHKYVREGKDEFADRKERAYRFNHTREVVDLIAKYVFKSSINRNEDDAPEELKTFWKKATRGGEGIDTMMRYVDRAISVFGQPYIVVDNTWRAREGRKLTQREAKEQKGRVYAYVVRPQDVLDVSFDEHGEIEWILLHESKRDDANFFKTDHDTYSCYRLWDRTHSYLYKVREATAEETGEKLVMKRVGVDPFKFTPSSSTHQPKKSMVVEEIQSHEHNLGEVPVFPVRDRESDNPYYAPALIDDIAYLDRAVANYLSNLDAIIQDQTFSTLTIPVQSLEGAEDMYKRIVELGTKRIFAWDGEGGEGPRYLSPDPRQAGMILQVITKIITEIYHSIGMAGERTKMDNAAGIDNSSGVAKAYDFDRMNTMLKAKADRLQDAENKIARLVMLWHSKSLAEDLVTYSEDFDTRGLYDEFDVANRLTLLDAPEELRRYQFMRLIDKMFPQLKKDLKQRIEKELEDWPAEEVDVTSTTATLKDQKKPAADNKQGQSTEKE